MRCKFSKCLGLMALSAAITTVFVHAALRAQEDDNSKTGGVATSALRIKDQSAGAQGQREKSAESSIQNELERASSDGASKSAGSRHAAEDQRAASASEGELKPVANPDETGPGTLEAASFKGVTPGITTIAEVEKLWGPPKEIFNQNELMTQLFSVAPFDRVEVSFQKEKVSSIVIRFDKPFPADKIAQQLDMASVKPVLVSNELGEILGEVFPERGVLFAFEAGPDKGKPSMRVIHIILEPLNAEPFVLRAETEMDSRYDLSLRDLELALGMQPNNARANWLSARALSAGDQLEKAETAAAKAIRLEPENPRYRFTRAQILGKMGRSTDAMKEAEQALDICGDRVHLQARAYCLLGDLAASGPKPDYRKAVGYHTKAVQTADSVAADSHPAIRITAKEVLVDAHLGAVHDIAWGDWKEKDTAVGKWLDRAASFADDLVQNEGGSEENQFRVCTRAVTAYVGLRGKGDPKPWIQGAVSHGNDLIETTADPLRKAQYQWDLGMALYDVVQVYQLRADHSSALKYGEAAAEYLEKGNQDKQTLTTAYVLGRLYFRLGAIHAIRDKNHEEAIAWFNKAAPLLMKPLPAESEAELGREGETFVSMGVSYWETKQRDKALELTQHGIAMMEEAVKKGHLERSALIVPYNNVSAMHRTMGAVEKADRYQEMAAKLKDSKVK
jgi:tetratricopeptide (TPR) repeat protein